MGRDNENLKAETIRRLADHDKTPADVRWVGSADGLMAITWEQFAAIADIQYDAGFGGQEIAQDLVVVGDGWYFEREEYDGSECWGFKKTPVRAPNATGFEKVKCDRSWATLKQCQMADPYGDA